MFKAFVLALVLACNAWAQGVYVGGGPSAYASTTPRFAENLMVGICTATEATCSLTNVEGRGDIRNPTAIMYSVESGIKQRMALVTNNAFSAELFSLVMGGGNIASSSAGGVFSGGGGITFRPNKFPNWSLTVAVRAAYSPVNPGWQPWANVQVGYTFHSAISTTLKAKLLRK